jgi:nucleoid-associated protein YejK
LRFTYYKGKDLTIIFDNAQLDKTVFYDKNKKQLTFKELPEDLINQLEK